MNRDWLNEGVDPDAEAPDVYSALLNWLMSLPPAVLSAIAHAAHAALETDLPGDTRLALEDVIDWCDGTLITADREAVQ